MRAKTTTPTASAPPSRNATTPMATVKAHSAVHTAPNASCARSRLGLRAVAEKARADVAKPLRTLCDTTDSITGRVSSQGAQSGATTTPRHAAGSTIAFQSPTGRLTFQALSGEPKTSKSAEKAEHARTPTAETSPDPRNRMNYDECRVLPRSDTRRRTPGGSRSRHARFGKRSRKRGRRPPSRPLVVLSRRLGRKSGDSCSSPHTSALLAEITTREELVRLGPLLDEAASRAAIDPRRLILRIQDAPGVNAAAGAGHIVFLTSRAIGRCAGAAQEGVHPIPAGCAVRLAPP
jgi:hypothetical protein